MLAGDVTSSNCLWKTLTMLEWTSERGNKLNPTHAIKLKVIVLSLGLKEDLRTWMAHLPNYNLCKHGENSHLEATFTRWTSEPTTWKRAWHFSTTDISPFLLYNNALDVASQRISSIIIRVNCNPSTIFPLWLQEHTQTPRQSGCRWHALMPHWNKAAGLGRIWAQLEKEKRGIIGYFNSFWPKI